MGKPWVPHVVQQGDHLRKLAFLRGVSAEAVWQHETNRDLAARRKNSDTLCPGDVIHLPAEPPTTLDLRAKTRNRYRAKVPTVPLHLHLDTKGAPVTGQRYEVHGIGAGDPIIGTVPANGEIRVDVPVCVRELEIRLPESGTAIPVRLGDLDPIEEPSGVAQRLANLGYLSSREDASPELVAAAIKAFQADHGLASSGSLDESTRRALEEQHLG